MIANHGVDNGTPGRRNARGFNVPSLTSTSSMTVDNHFRFDNFQLILFSYNLSTKCFQFATKMRIKLYFSNNKLGRIRRADVNFAQHE